MSPISASDPKTLIAYQRGLKWPSIEPPDKDEFLSDIMEILDDEDDTIGATLLYLGRKHMPPERLIESIRDLYRTRFSSYKEKLISHHTDSLKNKAHISEIIAFIDDLSEIAANVDIWINNNLQKLAKRRTKWWQFWRGYW